MLPRNRIIFLILVFSLGTGPALAADDNLFIRFYQEHISVVDGNRCPMYPSCSAYAAGALKKHGPVLGWIMACDRLVRCGRDESQVSMVQLGKHQLIYDPVSANDFWWFETRPDKNRPDKTRSNKTGSNEKK